MICENNNFIFIHITKTAGTSVHHFFNKQNTKEKNHNLKYYIKKNGQEKFNNFFIWSIVRNPFDRVLSLYFHKKRQGKKFIYSNKYNFTDWIKIIFGENKGLNWSFDTCSNWLKNNKEKIEVDFICKFETLDKDWKLLCKKLGIKYKKLPEKNKSKKRKNKCYKKFYKGDEKAIKLIEDFYQEDIENFNYQF